jgi:hypothetical protein
MIPRIDDLLSGVVFMLIGSFRLREVAPLMGLYDIVSVA